jgi:uncharacterized membrane protein YgaE (UPF0421/DUF939 family)
MNLRMKLGARILKTGIAITLALFLATLIGLPAPVFAGIAAVFAIQPSIYRSYLSVIEQFQANVIGAVFAVIFVLLFGNDPFIIGLTAIIVIGLNIKLKIEKTISVSIVTVIAIMESPGEQFIEFSLLRFSTIMLGILSAFIVNLVFIPPKYEKKLYDQNVEQTEEIFKWIRVNTRHVSEHNTLKTEIEKIKENMMKLDQLYLFFKEERNYFQKNKVAKSRKLVLFRQMILTTNKAFDTLRKLHRFENELHHMPTSFQQLFIKEIDDLINFHEQILLRFDGKIKAQQPHHELKSDLDFDKKKVIDAFLQHQDSEDLETQDNWYQLLSLVSSIIDYSDQLEHLDLLIASYQTYHQKNQLTK